MSYIRTFEQLDESEKEDAKILKHYGEQIRDRFIEITKNRPRRTSVEFIGNPVGAAGFHFEVIASDHIHTIYFDLMLSAVEADGYRDAQLEKLVRAYTNLFPKADNKIDVFYDEVLLSEQFAPARDVQADKIAVYEAFVGDIEREIALLSPVVPRQINTHDLITWLKSLVRTHRKKLEEIDGESEE